MNAPVLLCDACVVNQANQPFSLWQGLSESHQTALLDFSKNDSLVTHNTSDQQRFSSPAKLAEWLNKDHMIYALTPTEKPDELSGLIWFSHEPFPFAVEHTEAKNSQWTFAIRLYKDARGKRLSIPFMKKVLWYFQQEHPDKAVWLSTRTTNQISQKIYGQFGFEPVAEQDGKLFYVYNNRV